MELYHESSWPLLVICGVFRSWSFYDRQSHKLARPIGWLCLYERKYSPLVGEDVLLKHLSRLHERKYFPLEGGEVLLKIYEPFLRNMTPKLALSCQLLTRFRHLTCFLFLCFYEHQSDKPAAYWLLRLIWKETFLTLCRESIIKKLRVVIENQN